MLNSAEHEILNAHKYKNIMKLSIFLAQIILECYFLLIKVEIPTTVFVAEKVSCSAELSMKKFYNLGAK